MDGREFCGHDTLLSANSNIVGDMTVSYSISDLSFFGNTDNKAASDFLHYGWPEIGNFDDVDRMFRSCDSTFGLGVSGEDELGWLSSAGDLDLEGSGDMLKSDVKFPCPELNIVDSGISGNHASMEGCHINISAANTAPIRSEDSSWTSEEALVTGTATADHSNGFIPHEQINKHRQYIKLPNQCKGEGKEYPFQNVIFNCGEEQPIEVMQPPGLRYHQDYPYIHTQHFTQCPNLYSNSHSSDLASVNLKPCTTKSENNDLSSLLSRDSFSAHSQLQYMENCTDNCPLEASGLAINQQREKLQTYQGSHSSFNSSISNGNAAIFDSTSVRNHGNYGDPEGVSSATPAEFGSLTVQESLTTSSGRDDQSLETTSFRQLQIVMEQLDWQTKLCIRDGLYRLARNADKRHNLNARIRCGDGRESTADASVHEETKTSFADMETDTNPIDRSIAHLLFHRLPDSSSSTTPARNSFHTVICSE